MEPAESGQEQKVKKIVLCGLKDPITEEYLHHYFDQFGIVEKVETFTDKETNKRKGFCFIYFQDSDSVDECICKFFRFSMLGVPLLAFSYYHFNCL